MISGRCWRYLQGRGGQQLTQLQQQAARAALIHRQVNDVGLTRRRHHRLANQRRQRQGWRGGRERRHRCCARQRSCIRYSPPSSSSAWTVSRAGPRPRLTGPRASHHRRLREQGGARVDHGDVDATRVPLSLPGPEQQGGRGACGPRAGQDSQQQREGGPWGHHGVRRGPVAGVGRGSAGGAERGPGIRGGSVALSASPGQERRPWGERETSSGLQNLSLSLKSG